MTSADFVYCRTARKQLILKKKGLEIFNIVLHPIKSYIIITFHVSYYHHNYNICISFHPFLLLFLHFVFSTYLFISSIYLLFRFYTTPSLFPDDL
jgi:hypothetical protein